MFCLGSLFYLVEYPVIRLFLVYSYGLESGYHLRQKYPLSDAGIHLVLIWSLAPNSLYISDSFLLEIKCLYSSGWLENHSAAQVTSNLQCFSFGHLSTVEVKILITTLSTVKVKTRITMLSTVEVKIHITTLSTVEVKVRITTLGFITMLSLEIPCVNVYRHVCVHSGCCPLHLYV